MLPKLEEKSKKAAQDPKDQGKKDDVKKVAKAAKATLDSILTALTGGPTQTGKDTPDKIRKQGQKVLFVFSSFLQVSLRFS